jgi:hypothetical protein
MARPKKAKGDQPAAEQAGAGAADSSAEDSGEPKAHVSPDVLAGSPDIFAPSAAKPAAPSDETTGDEAAASSKTPEAEVAAEPVAEEAAPAPEPEAVAEAPAAAAIVEAPPVAPPPAPYVTAVPPHARRTSSTMALGIVLVVLGLFFLVIRILEVDLSRYGWPLYVIIPGLTLLAVGYASLGSGALIPGGIVTTAGLVLAYQSATEDWASWAYAWALVAPGGVGLGLFLQGLRNRDAGLIKQGRNLMFVAALIFMIGFVIFETIFNISNYDYGLFGKAALPGLLIVIGIILLARSLQRRRA